MKNSDELIAAKEKLVRAAKHSPGRLAADQAAIIKQFGFNPTECTHPSKIKARLSLEYHKALIEELGLKEGDRVVHKKWGFGTISLIKKDFTLQVSLDIGPFHNVSCSPSDVRQL